MKNILVGYFFLSGLIVSSIGTAQPITMEDSAYTDFKRIQLIYIEAEIMYPAYVKKEALPAINLPECPNVYISDSTVHVYRNDFDTANKAIVFIHYKHPGTNPEHKNTLVAFLKKSDTVYVSLALNSEKKFYKIIEKNGIQVLSSDKKINLADTLIKTYDIQQKDNPLVTYSIIEKHKITVFDQIPYKVEEDFGCE